LLFFPSLFSPCLFYFSSSTLGVVIYPFSSSNPTNHTISSILLIYSTSLPFPHRSFMSGFVVERKR
ncbi:MAG: hypothetical protein PUD65_11450, partial [Spirochaetales bacterium]|nr:hypothetical protein [Spirochaetales bacterium]